MDLSFYRLFIWFYRIGIRLLSPWNPKARKWLEGRIDIFAKLKSAMQTVHGELIWMHCASAGEFEQGLPLLEQLKKQYPAYKFLVTFFSSSGYELKKDNNAADYVFYLPSDSKKNAADFLRLTNPKLVLWVKNNYWFYYLQELKKRNIPVLLVSGIFRVEQPFFTWYGRLHKSMLMFFDHFFVQSDASKRLLGKIGISANVSIAGDTRFDRVIEIADQFQPLTLIEEFCGTNIPVIVAGNTTEEDAEVLDHYANAHPEIKFIIAPHSMDEEDLRGIKSLFKNSVYYSVVKTHIQTNPDITDFGPRAYNQSGSINVMIVDNIGMLSQLYKYATIAYVGGGFVDEGVHNVLEAAVYGKPVLFGPVIEDSMEALELVEYRGGMIVESALEVEEVLNRLLTNPEEYFACCKAAKGYVYEKRGATEKIITYIQENLLLTN